MIMRLFYRWMIINGRWVGIKKRVGFDGRGRVGWWLDLRFRGGSGGGLLHLFLLSCIFYTFLTSEL